MNTVGRPRFARTARRSLAPCLGAAIPGFIAFRLLVALLAGLGFVALGQIFVRRCHGGWRAGPRWRDLGAPRGLRSSDDSEMFTHAACLLLRRQVVDALAKLTEIARPLACPLFDWPRVTITLEPV